MKFNKPSRRELFGCFWGAVICPAPFFAVHFAAKKIEDTVMWGMPAIVLALFALVVGPILGTIVGQTIDENKK